jgi:hypothetical protein
VNKISPNSFHFHNPLAFNLSFFLGHWKSTENYLFTILQDRIRRIMAQRYTAILFTHAKKKEEKICNFVQCLCKGYKPKTVHSVRERTDQGL